MNLRSLKLVNFRGVRELSVRELARDGVVRVSMPSDAEPGALADAVAFALAGRRPEDTRVMVRGEGFAYVEVGLRLPGDARASAFRGLDRRNNAKVSLREAGGQRVTGGADGVERRLAELGGGDVEAFLRAALVPQSANLVIGSERAAVPGPGGEAARAGAERAVREFTRSLRAERLRAVALRRHEELTGVAGRLRRERAELLTRIDRLSAEREATSTRLGRDHEAREIARREELHVDGPGDAPPHSGSDAGRLLEWTLATACCAIVALLAYVMSVGSDAFGQPALRTYLGLGFLVAFALYLGAVSTRHRQGGRFMVVPQNGDRAAYPSVTRKQEIRDALRQRFPEVDLGDHTQGEQLHERNSEIAAELAPLRTRLERLDIALASADVESTRSVRALHLGVAPRDAGPTGLADGETPADAERRASEHGAAAFRAATERELLLADGVRDVEAARGVADAALTALAVVSDIDVAAARAGLADAQPGESEETVEDELCEQLLAHVGVAAVTASSGASAPPPVGDDLSALITTLSVGEYTGIARDSAGRTVLVRPSGARDELAELPPELRDRVDVGCRVASARAGLAGASSLPEFVVLDGVPTGLSDADLIDVVRAAAPGVRQILVEVTAA